MGTCINKVLPRSSWSFNPLDFFYPSLSDSQSSSPSNLFLFHQLTNQGLKQDLQKGSLGENHCVRIADNGSLEIKPVGSVEWDKVKRLASHFFKWKQFDSSERSENRRTWELFKRSVIEQAGKERFDWICKRYQMPVKRLEKGDPFLLRHVKIFYTGLSQFNVEWIEKQMPEIGALNRLKRHQLTTHVRNFYHQITSIFPENASHQPLSALSSRPQGSFFGVGALFHDERKALGTLWSHLASFQAVPYEKLDNVASSRSPLTTRFVPWLEEFCKGSVNRELMSGQLIPVPGEDGKEDWYQVYAKVSAKGLLAYGLKPLASDSFLNPLIVFRPTQNEIGAEDAIRTFQNDVELKIGSSGWFAAQEALTQLMDDSCFRKNGEKITVAGYSIGGAHLQYFLHQFSDEVKLAFSFNAPSINQELAEDFAEKINEASSRYADPLAIYVVRAIKDLVPKFGDRHLGHGVKPEQGVHVELVEVDFEDRKMRWKQHHTERAFGSRPCQRKCISSLEELDIKLDNAKRGSEVSWYQRLHQKWGWIAFCFFQFLENLAHFFYVLTGRTKKCDALQYKWSY